MRNEGDALATILQSQRTWAERAGIQVDSDGYVPRLTDNLFEELHGATHADLKAGSGGELGVNGARGKMQALHSSSAFACNLFGYWRERDPSRLARALGAADGSWKISFEKKVGTGVRGAIANLDLWCESQDRAVLAVESKYCEPYRARRRERGLSDSYKLTRDRSVWLDAGLRRCHEIAAITVHGEFEPPRVSWRLG